MRCCQATFSWCGQRLREPVMCSDLLSGREANGKQAALLTIPQPKPHSSLSSSRVYRAGPGQGRGVQDGEGISQKSGAALSSSIPEVHMHVKFHTVSWNHHGRQVICLSRS